MALTSTQTSDIQLAAATVKWGREECRKVTFVDDTAGDLTDEYFDMNLLDEDQVETSYYVLLSGTTPAVDPAPAGKTKIEVSYTDGDTASVIAGLFVTALSALNVNVSQTGAEVVVENKDIGKITVEVNTNAPSLTFAVLALGLGGDLGKTAEGGIAFSTETQVVSITSDQTGTNALGEVYTGSTASMSMTLIEMNLEKWELVIGSVTGDVFTPSAGTRLVGQGTSRLYKNLFDLGGKLILHPINRDASDKSFDMIFWKSAPKPSSINFSGQDIQGMEIEFVAYNDESKPEEISLWAQGDYSQELV